jgi:hypothetical protein
MTQGRRDAPAPDSPFEGIPHLRYTQLPRPSYIDLVGDVLAGEYAPAGVRP